MNISENEFRDVLFDNHKDAVSSLIIGKKDPVSLSSYESPPIHILLQHRVEKKINEILLDIENMTLTARELQLKKEGESTTRVDLFGESEGAGIIIIELKKSKQTERQAFTELLAYANHFCSIFPGLNESTITSVLIAPMETRTVRDAYAQEVMSNNKNMLALVPEIDGENIMLSVHYPDSSYYKWFENNLFDDRAMMTVAISFPVVDGWIDTDINSENKSLPQYTESALNTISSTISHKLESLGIHSIVYASQQWGEVGQLFPYPNTLYIVSMNPFASFRADVEDDYVYGESKFGRQREVQAIYDCLHQDNKDNWLERMESNFRGQLIRIARHEFKQCFLNDEGYSIETEITLPDWYGVKTSLFASVWTHQLETYLTGLLREIYTTYIISAYSKGDGCIFYGDNMPKYPYKAFREFLPIWEILRGIGLGEEEKK